jgi:acyl-coenzyme A thioesterase PaaI-like protein
VSDPMAGFVLELPFQKRIGLSSTEEGELCLPADDTLTNHVGTMHAGALFALGEGASGLAILRTVAPALGGTMPVAKNASISYRRPARGRIRARGSVSEEASAIKARLDADGKTSFDVAVSLVDDAGVEVATMTVTWHARREAT